MEVYHDFVCMGSHCLKREPGVALSVGDNMLAHKRGSTKSPSKHFQALVCKCTDTVESRTSHDPLWDSGSFKCRTTFK